jgi:tRNA threonylcarbamoyl adenosine modification protein YjeE
MSDSFEIFVEPDLQGPTVLKKIQSQIDKATVFPVVLFLKGPLGIGKTQFVKSFFAAFGGQQSDVQSPTFLKVLEYKNNAQKILVHADLYRVDKIEELERIGFLESLENASVVAIEWPEKLSQLAPDSALRRFFSKCVCYELRWKSLGRFTLELQK